MNGNPNGLGLGARRAFPSVASGCLSTLVPRCTSPLVDCSSGRTLASGETTDAGFSQNTRFCGGDEQTLQQTYFRGSASCVQSFDDSLDIACRKTYRISLRSSSLWEPRHPLLKVLISLIYMSPLRGAGNVCIFVIILSASEDSSITSFY